MNFRCTGPSIAAAMTAAMALVPVTEIRFWNSVEDLSRFQLMTPSSSFWWVVAAAVAAFLLVVAAAAAATPLSCEVSEKLSYLCGAGLSSWSLGESLLTRLTDPARFSANPEQSHFSWTATNTNVKS